MSAHHQMVVAKLAGPRGDEYVRWWRATLPRRAALLDERGVISERVLVGAELVVTRYALKGEATLAAVLSDGALAEEMRSGLKGIVDPAFLGEIEAAVYDELFWWGHEELDDAPRAAFLVPLDESELRLRLRWLRERLDLSGSALGARHVELCARSGGGLALVECVDEASVDPVARILLSSVFGRPTDAAEYLLQRDSWVNGGERA